ncbi:hypothetical protein T261_1955 [Streptomyces lydicus]|nr:hypothetical protein T261_1955 [Streptomyces lydicus]
MLSQISPCQPTKMLSYLLQHLGVAGGHTESVPDPGAARRSHGERRRQHPQLPLPTRHALSTPAPDDFEHLYWEQRSTPELTFANKSHLDHSFGRSGDRFRPASAAVVANSRAPIDGVEGGVHTRGVCEL